MSPTDLVRHLRVLASRHAAAEITMAANGREAKVSKHGKTATRYGRRAIFAKETADALNAAADAIETTAGYPR